MTVRLRLIGRSTWPVVYQDVEAALREVRRLRPIGSRSAWPVVYQDEEAALRNVRSRGDFSAVQASSSWWPSLLLPMDYPPYLDDGWGQECTEFLPLFLPDGACIGYLFRRQADP